MQMKNLFNGEEFKISSGLILLFKQLYYSVFKKEGNKVNAYYTNKKRHFGSTMRFFPTTT